MNGAFKGLCSLYFILGFSLKFQVSLFYWKKFYQIQISLKSLNYSKFEVVDSISANAFLTFSIFFIVLCFFPPTSLSLFKCIRPLFFLGAFLIPYILFLFLGGVPLFFLELSLGQLCQEGPIKAWQKICPLLSGM